MRRLLLLRTTTLAGQGRLLLAPRRMISTEPATVGVRAPAAAAAAPTETATPAAAGAVAGTHGADHHQQQQQEQATSTSGRPEPLDRSAFTQILTVPALRVPVRRCSELMKAFRG